MVLYYLVEALLEVIVLLPCSFFKGKLPLLVCHTYYYEHRRLYTEDASKA